MSVSILLLPIAIALIATVGSGVSITSVIHEKMNKKTKHQELPPMMTLFADLDLLEKTLQEHGIKTERTSENELVCTMEAAVLTYSRDKVGDPFYVTTSGLKDINELMEELKCLDEEYKSNVQSFTYDKLISNLSSNNMTLHSETILEDNTILLTIDV